jgi:RNA polymerase sigma-70 factor (ECF subfamily)
MEAPVTTAFSFALEDAGGGTSGEPSAAEVLLIERAQRDRAAFAELYRLHYAAIGGYLYRRCGDVHATEDMLAETFLSALRALPRFRPGGVPFRHWLYRIATNVANRRARRLRRRPMPLEEPHELVDPSSQPDAPAFDRDLVAAVLALPAAQQAVLALHYVEGLSVGEVASVLRCRPGTVKSRLARARDALARRLDV